MSREVEKTHGLLAEIRDGLKSLHTQTRAALAAQTCYGCELATFNTNGVIARSIPAGYAALAITNLSADPVTVTSDTQASTAPSSGAGVALIPGNGAATVNLAGRAFTLYGTAGDQVVVQVFAATQPPAWG
jgi:hypothetical protein